MSRVKDIKVKVIPSKLANEFVKRNHYSGKIVPNSKLHFGCFLDGKLGGVMSYGTPMDRSKVIHLVNTDKTTKNEKWNQMLELNRMAFSDRLPRMSESRCIAISFRLLKKHAPHVKWILSFSDGCSCGDGTIYRASGFKLTQIKPNSTLWLFPDGAKIADITYNSASIEAKREICEKYNTPMVATTASKQYKEIGATRLPGYQLRYIYILDKKNCSLNCPDLPFSKIDEVGAGMYLGEKLERKGRNQTANSLLEGEHDNISPHTQEQNTPTEGDSQL